MNASVLESPVLVLNKDWRPLRLAKVSEALADLFVGKVEAVDGDWAQYDFDSWRALSASRDRFTPAPTSALHGWVRTVCDDIPAPAVVRRLKMERAGKRSIRLTRRNVYLRDNYTCQYTGQKLPAKELNLDHVLPQSRGGRSTWTNLVCCSVAVNQRKGNRTPAEAGLTLLREPRKPEAHEIALRASPVRHPTWEAFVSEAYWNTTLSDEPVRRA